MKRKRVTTKYIKCTLFGLLIMVIIVSLNIYLFFPCALKQRCDNKNFDIEIAFNNLRKLMQSQHIEEVVSFLESNPSLVNKSDIHGITPLHIATYYEDMNLVDNLLKQSASPDLRTTDGFTALHIAIYKNNYPLTKRLLETKEVDINKPTKEDLFTPIHIAIRFCNQPYNILEELIKAGANINSKTKRGRTPLHLAVIRGDAGSVQYLIQKGANINTITTESDYDQGGKTPLDDALESGQTEISELLKAHGAHCSSYNDESSIN